MNEELEAWIDAYIQAQETEGVDGNHPLWWAIDRFMDAIQSDPESAWDAIVGIARRQPSEKVIGMLSAGPLEDLIDRHGDVFINRIELLARTNACFRRMLGHVWESGTPEVWRRVEAAKMYGR